MTKKEIIYWWLTALYYCIAFVIAISYSFNSKRTQIGLPIIAISIFFFSEFIAKKNILLAIWITIFYIIMFPLLYWWHFAPQ